MLAKSGVKTYGIGKWHNGPASYARAFDDGAAIFFGGMHDHTRIPVHAFSKNGKYPKASEQIGDVFSTELFANAAVDFVKNYHDDAPFFLYVALTAPHDPRTPPGKYKAMYDPAKLTVPKNFLPEHPFDNGELKVRDELLAPFPRTEKIVQQHLADYYGMISHLDEQVGCIFDAVAASTHRENTIIIFAADNGLAVGQHGLFGKQSLYDHSIRVPLIIAGPGIPAGQRSPALVYLHDLFATICELQSVELPPKTESHSLLPIAQGKKTEGRQIICAAYRDVQRMVRRGDLKLIYYPKIDRTQVFDLAKDPWETNDLTQSEEFVKSKEFGELKRLALPIEKDAAQK
jgi:arylsulfatase A-like enzyme